MGQVLPFAPSFLDLEFWSEVSPISAILRVHCTSVRQTLGRRGRNLGVEENCDGSAFLKTMRFSPPAAAASARPDDPGREELKGRDLTTINRGRLQKTADYFLGGSVSDRGMKPLLKICPR
jgi:hypothetical protein